MTAKERSEFRGGRRQPDPVGLGVEWSGLMVGSGQIGNVEQEGEQDRCVKNELCLGWIRLGW